MSNTTPAPQRGGLSLYANLLSPTASGSSTAPASISREPVVFKKDGDENTQLAEVVAKKQQIDTGALRFQPTRRPQLASQKAKPKNKPSRPTTQDAQPTELETSTSTSDAATRPPTKSTLADWTAADDDDVNGFYSGEKRQRGGRKRRKKNKAEYAIIQDWDDVYDPSRPNNYEEYKNSDEKIREVREWKDRLYAHRTAQTHSSELDSDEEVDTRPSFNNQFAPPTNYSFAPPPMDSPPQIPSTSEALIDVLTGDDAHARRLQLNQGVPPAPDEAPPPPPPISTPDSQITSIPLPPPPQTQPTPAISRAPVRYNLPAAPSELPASEAELEKALAQEEADEEDEEDAEEQERSRRPGQKGFAERLMSKYGWSKGSGLGADGSGIINPLRVQVEKRKKKSDAEGGGFRDPGGRGKIIGGKKKAVEKDDETGKFGAMSEVIVLKGMVDGMNLDEEVEGSGDGGLMQEIGDECSEKYGRVERVYIDRHGAGPAKVFVKFTSQLSGLRAVNALEGRIFNGNTISALFYDTEKFEQGIYD